MSYLRVTEPGNANVSIDDLGVTIAQSSTVILSNQFSVSDLYLSADLESLIIAGTLTVQLNYGTGWTTVSQADYTNRDTLGTFLNIYEITNENNNEDLVDGSDVNAAGPGGNPLHLHDARYYTETELGATTAPTGASLIGCDSTLILGSTATNVQQALEEISSSMAGAVDLDGAYDNDADGILNVDGTTKPLDFRSNNTNDVVISRTNSTVIQDILRADVSANELLLGAAVSGALAKVDVRVLTDLYVDGNIQFVGKITDTTVDNLNVANAEIMLREGAATGSDAKLKVERGSTGNDADLKWDEAADRWKAGVEGSEETIALLEHDELVTGVYEFQGGASTEPSVWLTEKSAAPTTNLGAAGQIPVAMMPDGILAVYDKSNSRNKFLSVAREQMIFTGRDSANNKDEYARNVLFTSNQCGNRLTRNATLLEMSIQTSGAETWTARVRKNGVVTNLASLAASAVAGAQATTYNVDFSAGDEIQVFIDSSGANIDRPFIKLVFANRF